MFAYYSTIKNVNKVYFKKVFCLLVFPRGFVKYYGIPLWDEARVECLAHPQLLFYNNYIALLLSKTIA